MELYINGKKAVEGMLARTFRGEPVKLLSWSQPGTSSGGKGGRVCVELGNGNRCEYFPQVVGGTFEEERL